MRHAGHVFCAQCIHDAFAPQSAERRLCPLCRSKQMHAPIRVPLVDAALQRGIAHLTPEEQEQCKLRHALHEERKKDVRLVSIVCMPV
jgi:hypothetical protein